MKINKQKIITSRQIWLSDIEGIDKDFKEYLLNDCREPFRFRMMDYCGDSLYGVIDIDELREFLEGGDYEENREEIPAKFIKQLEILLKIALENQIDEILFN